MIHVKQNMFTRWPPSWIWAFQVSGLSQLLCVSFMIVYTCQDYVLESLKIAFFVLIFDSKYSKMTPEFVKQKSVWLHSSIKFANPAWNCLLSFKSNYNVHMDSSSIVNKVQSVTGIINKKNYKTAMTISCSTFNFLLSWYSYRKEMSQNFKNSTR